MSWYFRIERHIYCFPESMLYEYYCNCNKHYFSQGLLDKMESLDKQPQFKQSLLTG